MPIPFPDKWLDQGSFQHKEVAMHETLTLQGQGSEISGCPEVLSKSDKGFQFTNFLVDRSIRKSIEN